MNDPVDDSEMLVALMRTAATAQDAPPAAFGHADVVATSHRITRRRRMVAAGAAGLVLVAGIGTATVLPIANRDSASSTVAEAPRVPTTAPAGAPVPETVGPLSAGPAEPAPSGPRTPERVLPVPGQESAPAPAAPPEQAPESQDGAPAPAAPPAGEPDGEVRPRSLGPRDAQAPPAGSPQPADGSDGSGGGGYTGPGLGPSSGDCGKQQDPQLRSVVANVFPQAAGASAAPTAQSCRPAGERAVHLQLRDGDRTGILTVVYTPKGGASPGGDQTASTASGGRVGVSLKATGDGPAPFADQVGGLAAKLGPRL